jgi:RNA polymerase sigma-70 factor (ECF subfamily)
MDNLIKEILDGDKEKFREIVKKYNPEFLRIAFHYSGSWDDAKDIVQTSFIRIYKSLARFRLGQPFEPWIFRIHLNNCKSASRRLRWTRLRRVPLDNAQELCQEPESSASISAPLLKQIRSLSSRQRAAFVLVEIEGIPSVEAAKYMGCKESTLRVHLARAKANLQTKLRRIGVTDE